MKQIILPEGAYMLDNPNAENADATRLPAKSSGTSWVGPVAFGALPQP